MKRLFAVCLILILCLSLTGCASSNQAYEKYTKTFFGTFDTVITIQGFSQSKEAIDMAADQAEANGFTLMVTPTLVNPDIMAGTGFLGAHSDEIYYLPADDQYLVGTSEVALAGYHKDEIIDYLDARMAEIYGLPGLQKYLQQNSLE